MVLTHPSLVVLISGSGSNLQAIIDATASGLIQATICAVISNKKDAKGLKRAEQAGIPTAVIEHQHYKSRENFDRALMQRIDECQPDLVLLAGFMRILSDSFIEHYAGRLLNIHPSLLPKYKGLNTHQRALDAGDASHGASVHLVSSELDSGTVIIQAEVAVEPGDTAQTLASRVLEQEHKIYPLAVSLLTSGRLKTKGDALVLDGKPLPTPLLWKHNELVPA